MRCVRARPSLAVRWRHTNRDRPCEVCSCPYVFQWRSLREPWMREAWGAPSPDKPLKYSERRWGRERVRSIPFSDKISSTFVSQSDRLVDGLDDVGIDGHVMRSEPTAAGSPQSGSPGAGSRCPSSPGLVCPD